MNWSIGKNILSKRVGLRGRRSWQEPLSGYNGVLKEIKYYGYAEEHAPNYQSHISYALFLDHDDPARRVKLYDSTNILEAPSPDWERSWLHYAGLFNLPLLEKTSEGVVSATVENRNQPLIDKLVEGRVKATAFDLASPRLPTGLSLDRQDDLWVITLKPVTLLWSGITLLVIAIILFVLANSLGWFANDTITIVLGSVIGIAGLLYIASMLKKFTHPDQVAVGDSTVWHRTWNHKKGGWDVKSLGIGDIKRIALGTKTNRNQLEHVMVSSENTTLEFGTRLSAKSRRKLRDLLLFLISLPENSLSKR